jgi:hypothetical protein
MAFNIKNTIDLSKLSHNQLEMLSEEAEDWMYDHGIHLNSHSYTGIITQALHHGFKLK